MRVRDLAELPRPVLAVAGKWRGRTRWPKAVLEYLEGCGFVNEDGWLTAAGRVWLPALDRAFETLRGGVEYGEGEKLLPAPRGVSAAANALQRRTKNTVNWLGPGTVADGETRCWLCTGHEMWSVPADAGLALPETEPSLGVKVWAERVGTVLGTVEREGARQEVWPAAISLEDGDWGTNLENLVVWLSGGVAVDPLTYAALRRMYPLHTWAVAQARGEDDPGRNGYLTLHTKPDLTDRPVAVASRRRTGPMPEAVRVLVEQAEAVGVPAAGVGA